MCNETRSPINVGLLIFWGALCRPINLLLARKASYGVVQSSKMNFKIVCLSPHSFCCLRIRWWKKWIEKHEWRTTIAAKIRAHCNDLSCLTDNNTQVSDLGLKKCTMIKIFENGACWAAEQYNNCLCPKSGKFFSWRFLINLRCYFYLIWSWFSEIEELEVIMTDDPSFSLKLHPSTQKISLFSNRIMVKHDITKSF